MIERPKIPNTPGITWRDIKDGIEARWRPRADLVKRGFPIPIHKLWRGHPDNMSEIDRRFISERCTELQGEMLVWARGGITATPVYDRTLTTLIACYKTDPDSGYQTLQFRTRQNYNSYLKVVDDDHGDVAIRDIKARLIKRWHEGWSERGVSMAHGLIGILRTLTTFGANYLECDDCRALKVTLHDMRFKNTNPRTVHLTAEQAIAVRAQAHKVVTIMVEKKRTTGSFPSIALAQAFQFEGTMRQKDVIGEWLPINEPGVSDVIDEEKGLKWVKGLRWEEIDENMILRHMTSKKQKPLEVDLKHAPMVLEELARLGERPTKGPVIIDERRGLPWGAPEFRRVWRQTATAAGVPKNVYNMDTRAGAITEAFDAGAAPESVRKAATHSNLSMTARYSRGDAKAITDVMQLRAANRNKGGTSGS